MMVGCRRPRAPRPPDLDEDNTPPLPLCHLAIRKHCSQDIFPDIRQKIFPLPFQDNTPPPPLCHLAINPLPGNTALRIFFLMIAKNDPSALQETLGPLT